MTNRNDKCPCGSNKKWKKCCMSKEYDKILEEKERIKQEYLNTPKSSKPSKILSLLATMNAMNNNDIFRK